MLIDHSRSARTARYATKGHLKNALWAVNHLRWARLTTTTTSNGKEVEEEDDDDDNDDDDDHDVVSQGRAGLHRTARPGGSWARNLISLDVVLVPK